MNHYYFLTKLLAIIRSLCQRHCSTLKSPEQYLSMSIRLHNSLLVYRTWTKVNPTKTKIHTPVQIRSTSVVQSTHYLPILTLPVASCILDHGHRVIDHGHDSSHGTPQGLLLSFESTPRESRTIPEHQ